MPDELSPAEREAMAEADKTAWRTLDVGEMTGEQAEVASWALTHGLTAGFLAARTLYGPDARAECERLRTAATELCEALEAMIHVGGRATGKSRVGEAWKALRKVLAPDPRSAQKNT